MPPKEKPRTSRRSSPSARATPAARRAWWGTDSGRLAGGLAPQPGASKATVRRSAGRARRSGPPQVMAAADAVEEQQRGWFAADVDGEPVLADVEDAGPGCHVSAPFRV